MIKRQTSFTSKCILASLLACVVSSGVADERGQSIMFSDRPGSQTDNPLATTHSPMESMRKTDARCQQLAKEIDQLKGKPQRRHAAIQRFKQECNKAPSDE